MKQIHISSKNLLHHLRNIGVLRLIKIIPVFLLSVFILSACMKDDYEEVEEVQCPDVISTNPERDGTTDITSDITVTFNKEMCLDAVKESFFVILDQDTITGEIYTNDDKTFGFRPEFNLKAGSSYEAIVTTDVADCFGLTLIGGDYKWTFDTDNVAPQVISTNPANGALSVLRNIAIEIEFDKDINTNTISIDMFTLEDVNGNPVDIFNWEYSNRVITIHPDNLAPGTTFTATLKSGIEDLLGYFTEDDYIWNFTTGFDFQVIPRSVNLRSVSRFSVFSSDFITNISGANSQIITGDVGIIPGLVTDITGIDVVGGEIIADSPLPIDSINPILILAKNDLSAAYLFAKNAINPDPEPLTGNQFTPGIYKSDISYTINNNIILDGENNPNAFWIFQIDGALNADSGIEIVLINGAHPNNVFWQVGDVASIGANTSFMGNIMAKEGIELSDGASITGRLLVKNGGISLNNNTIVLP